MTHSTGRMENIPIITIRREQWNTNPIVLPKEDEQWQDATWFSSHMDIVISNTAR
jgi:hypothetical protein